MNENAYKSPAAIGPRGTRSGARWAIWSGITFLVIAAACGVLTVARMMFAFERLSGASGAVRASDLAEGISVALVPAMGVLPFGILGGILLAIGFLARRPA